MREDGNGDVKGFWILSKVALAEKKRLDKNGA
jgi:hypothetical protein